MHTWAVFIQGHRMPTNASDCSRFPQKPERMISKDSALNIQCIGSDRRGTPTPRRVNPTVNKGRQLYERERLENFGETIMSLFIVFNATQPAKGT
jgi:hypothetical protein